MASEIPDKCSLSCPVVRLLQADIGIHEEIEDTMIHTLVSDDLDESLRNLGETVESLSEDLIDLTAEELAKSIRESGSKALKDEKELIEQHRRDLGNMALGCRGPLKMRATHDGVEFTVTVCTSSTMVTIAETGLQFARIERRPVE